MKEYKVSHKNGIISIFRNKKELCQKIGIKPDYLDNIVNKVETPPDNIKSISVKITEKEKKTKISKPNKKRNTPYGRAQEMWTNIKFRLKNNESYKDVTLNMTRHEFIKWAMPRIEKCFRDNMLSPSVDRVNPDKGYEISNIEIIPKKENCRKQFTDRPELREVNRVKSRERFSKPVILEFKDGTSKKYDSASDVDREIGRYHGYTYYRLKGERPLPKNWISVEFL